MQKVRASFWIYLIGVAALGLFLGKFETAARQTYGGWLVFLGVAVYLLMLRRDCQDFCVRGIA